MFERATVVFMGGTLPRRGGHNILEPAYFGKPVIVGPHMENFADIIKEFSAADAVVKIDGPDDLVGAVESLLDNPARAAEIGMRARALAEAKRGTADHVVEKILAAVEEAVPDPPHTLEARLTRGPLAAIWKAGHAANISRTHSKKLDTAVISIGALAMGGAGKSPFVAHLAQKLAEAGRNPAILTRGYGRKSRLDVIVPRGGSAPVAETGDEAQAYVRQGAAHVGIGADRYAVGRRMEKELKPDVFLLDDGFQHFRLQRDRDIVLIDALDPLGGGVFPLGRLREPFSALARATAVVITRAENRHLGIERLIRRYNSRRADFPGPSRSARPGGRAHRPGSAPSAGSASRERSGGRLKPWASMPRRAWCFPIIIATPRATSRRSASGHGGGRPSAGDHRKRYDEFAPRILIATTSHLLLAHRD